MTLIFFGLAAISDFLDGYLARKYNASSDLGKMLDPLADKTLMIISYVLLAHVEAIPAYMAMIVAGRDFLILTVIGACKMRNINLEIRPHLSSKINTTIQLIFIVLVLACKSLSMHIPWFLDLGGLVVSVSTIFSGAVYVQKYYWIKDKLLQQ
jgi:cardiolipin synthase